MQRSHLGAWNELQTGSGTHPVAVTNPLEQGEQSTARAILSPALTPPMTKWISVRGTAKHSSPSLSVGSCGKVLV